MGDWRNYFSFRGRLNRKPYWLMSLALIGVGIVAFIVVGMLAAMRTLFWVLAAPLLIAFVWANLSLNTRRAHDRGKSAWWLLLYQGVPVLLDVLRFVAVQGGAPAGPANVLGFIVFCIGMWVFVDLGVLKGTAGQNRFGDDPLEPAVQEVFA
jgi:uncharacterized membrane protein YhaH (DUF805 family)